MSGAPAKSTTSCFLTETRFCLGKHRVSSRGGFESLTVAPAGDIKLGYRKLGYGFRFVRSFAAPALKSRLIADLDPDEWDLPPKPKWMRWATYNRYEVRYDRYEEILDFGCAVLAAKLFAIIC